MNNVYYRFVRLASDQDRAKLPAMLRMNVTASPGVPRTGSELWSAVPIFVRRSRYAVLLAASAIASPAFAQEKSRDLATFFSGHLTATGQFVNNRDGSTRGVGADIRGARWRRLQARPDGARGQERSPCAAQFIADYARQCAEKFRLECRVRQETGLFRTCAGE